MSQPSRIDTRELRAMVSTLERLIAEAARTVGELKATIASAEALVSGDHHDEQAVAARTEAVIAQEPAAESSAEADRKAMPTPWSRRPPATPWSRRVVRPCPTVPSTPVRVSAPRATGVPIAELPGPARQPAASRRSEFEFTRGRTGTVGDSGSVRRTDSADDIPAPQVAVSADSAPIRRTEYVDPPAPVQRADTVAIQPPDVVDSAPIRRTGGAPSSQIDNLHAPRSAGRTSITSGPASTRETGTTHESAARTTHADGLAARRKIDAADDSRPIHRTGYPAPTASAPPSDSAPIRQADFADESARTETGSSLTSQFGDAPPREAAQNGLIDHIGTVSRTGVPPDHEPPQKTDPDDFPPRRPSRTADDSAKTDTAPRPEPVPPRTHGFVPVQRTTAAPVEDGGNPPVRQTDSDDFTPHRPSRTADDPTKTDTAPRHEPVPLTADGFPPIKRTAAVPVEQSATPHHRPPGQFGQRTEHIQGTAAQRADTPRHFVPRQKDSSSTVPQADPGQLDTADASPSVAEIDTAHGAEPVPPIDTADEPVAIERTDTTSRPARTIADDSPARADNEHRSELISPIDLANCLASASVQRTLPRSTESATPRRPAPTQQFEATDDIAADGRTGDKAAIQQTDPRATESATPWGPAPIRQPDTTYDSAPAQQSEAADDIAAGGRTDDCTPIERIDLASNNESGTPNHPAPIQRTPGSAEHASGRQAPATAALAPRSDRTRDSPPEHSPAPTPQHNRTHHSPPEQRPTPTPNERTNTRHRPPLTPQTTDTSEVDRIAQEMSERHGLKLVGFDAVDVDVHAVREIVSAIDDLLAKYPIPLRGVELTDDPESRPRPKPTTMAEGSAEVWIVLDKAAPQPPAGTATQQTRRRFRRRGPVERPVYSTVVREFARALDAAGGFRARQEALRTLINESLLRGGSGAGLLDPGRALVEGFTEVVLRGDRAGASAKELHAALVKMARAESTDLPEPTDVPEPTDLPESTDLSA